MRQLAAHVVLMAVLAAGMLRGGGLEVEMQEDWALKISHPAAGTLCDYSTLTVVSGGHLVYYMRQMGAYWHENVPVNEAGVARLVQYADAKSRHWFRLDDYSARLSEDGGKLTIHLAGSMQNGESGFGEYALLCLPKCLADGASFQAVAQDGSTVEGAVPEEDTSACLAANCRSLTIAMPCGRLSIQVEQGEPLTLLDRRQSGYHRGKCLFVGLVSRDMATPLDSTVTLSFTPDVRRAVPKPLSVQADAAWTRVPVSFSAPARDYKVNTQCIVPKEYEDFGAAESRPIPFRVSYPPLPQEDRRRLQKAVTRLGALPVPLAFRLLENRESGLPKDGFAIERGGEAITVTGGTPRALFYGIQALRDLDLGRLFRLKDWPDMEFRAVSCYFFTEESLDCLPFFLQEIWTRGRLNAVILKCDDSQWETLPELWQNREEPPPRKEQLRHFVQECRDNYIEPIPFITLFSHVEWLFRDGHHLELAENPDRPYNYNVNDPRLFELLEPLMDEILDVFKPRYFHIGHDEIDHARTLIYPSRPENKALGMAELYRRSVWHLHDFLAKRNVKTMLWHDGMCAATEGEWGNPADFGDIQAFRATLPKDLVVMFWQYDDGRAYGGLGQLKKEGFTAVGCPWYNEGNIRNMVAEAKRHHAYGVCGTTWWPLYNWNYICRHAYPYQFPAQLMTACYAWGGEGQAAIPTRRYADIVYGLMNQQVILDEQGEASGYALDLSPVANYCPEGMDLLLGADFRGALKPGQTLKVGRGAFVVPERDGRLAAVAMQSLPDGVFFPQRVALPVTGRVGVLHLLGALTGAVPGSHNDTQVLDVLFRYEDGTATTKTLEYNYGVGHVHGRASYALNQATSVEGVEGRLWDNAVANPAPEKRVAGVELVSRGYGFVLFGVSCEESSAP